MDANTYDIAFAPCARAKCWQLRFSFGSKKFQVSDDWYEEVRHTTDEDDPDYDDWGLWRAFRCTCSNVAKVFVWTVYWCGALELPSASCKTGYIGVVNLRLLGGLISEKWASHGVCQNRWRSKTHRCSPPRPKPRPFTQAGLGFWNTAMSRWPFWIFLS